MKLHLQADYSCQQFATIELPENRKPEDIQEIGTKWNTVWIMFKDETDIEIEVEFDGSSDNFKRADEAYLYDENNNALILPQNETNE